MCYKQYWALVAAQAAQRISHNQGVVGSKPACT